MTEEVLIGKGKSTSLSGPGQTTQIKNMRVRQKRFMKAYLICKNIGKACAAIKIHRNTYQQWIQMDPQFLKEWVQLKQQVIEDLEAEAIRRATRGVRRAVWHKGEVVGHERVQSDLLLIFMLKGMAPEKYRDNYVVNIPQGGAVGSAAVSLSQREQIIRDPNLRQIACDLEERISGFSPN